MGPEDSVGPPHSASPATTGAPPTAPVGKAVALLGSSSLVAFLAGVARQKIFAVFLGPAGVGALSLAVSLFDTLGHAARLGVPNGLLREGSRALAKGRPDQADRAYRMSRTLLLTVSTLLFACTFVLRGWIGETVLRGALPIWVAPFVASAVPLLVLANLSDAMLAAHGAVARLAGAKVAITLGSLALMVPLVVWLGFTGALLQVWTGAAVAALVTVVACRHVFRSDGTRARSVPDPIAKTAFKAVLAIGAAEAIYHVAASANLFAFRVLVVRELGLDANGLYQVTLGISRQWVPAVLGGVFVALYPRLGALVEDRDSAGRELRSALELVFVIGIPAVLVLLATRDWIITVLLAESFRGAEPLLRLSGPGDLAALVSGVLHISLLALGAIRGFLIAGLVVEATYLVLVWGSIGPLGLAGPVAAYGLTSLLSAGIFLAILRTRVSGRFDRSSRLRFVLGVVLVLGAASLPSPAGAGRWTILACAIAWGWGHRRRIREEFAR